MLAVPHGWRRRSTRPSSSPTTSATARPALFYTGTIRGIRVEEATRVRLDDEGRVTEITLRFRPLPGLTALMAGLAPRLARRRGKGKAAATALMTRPLAAMTKHGDKVAVKLVE